MLARSFARNRIQHPRVDLITIGGMPRATGAGNGGSSRRARLLATTGLALLLVAYPGALRAEEEAVEGETVIVTNETYEPPGNWFDVGFQQPDSRLEIRDNGIVISPRTYVGFESTAEGYVLVDGDNAQWEITGSYLSVGYEGSGTVEIRRGTVEVESTLLVGDQQAGADGTLILDHPDAVLDVGNNLLLGDQGTGQFDLWAGFVSTGGVATLGNNSADSVGRARVVGSDAEWHIQSTGAGLTIGNFGMGDLILGDNARIEVANTWIARRENSTGRLVIGSDPDDGAPISPGTLAADTVTLGEGSSELLFHHSGTGDYEFGADIVNDPGSDFRFEHRAGRTLLTGANTFTSDITLSGGTLVVESDSNLGNANNAIAMTGGGLEIAGTGFGTLARDVTLDASGGRFKIAEAGQTVTVTGDMSGPGDFTLDGAGTLTFSGDASYTGDTVISGGTLRSGGAGALAGGGYELDGGTLDLAGFDQTIAGLSGASGTVDLGSGTLSLDQAGDTDYGGALTGTGTLGLSGGGGLALSGDSSGFGGTVSVADAGLSVSGTLGGSVNVGSGGELRGTGSAGAVTVTGGGRLFAGNSPGTITLASLELDSGSTTRFVLNTPGVVGGDDPDDGNTLVDVTGDLTLGGTLEAAVDSAGYYRLFDYGGALGGAFDTLDVSGIADIADEQVLTDIDGQVNLLVRGSGQLIQFWDGTDETGDGTVGGGSGTWSDTATTWTGAPGSAEINDRWRGSVAVFGGGSGGTVTVDGVQEFDTLQFTADGYTLTGDALGFDPASGDDATINVDGGRTATIAANLTGTADQGLAVTGGGTLVLSGDNSYGGGTIVRAGTLRLDGGSTDHGGSAFVVADTDDTSASVFIENGHDLTSAGVVIGAASGATGTMALGGAGTSLSGDDVVIGALGDGALTLEDGATLAANAMTLADDAAAAGTITLSDGAGAFTAGSLTFGAGDGRFVLDHGSGGYGLDLSLSGDGAVDILSGVTDFTGDGSLFSGTTTVEDATLSVSAAASLGGSTGIGQGGLLVADGQLDDVTVGDSGILGGFGSLQRLTVEDGGRFVVGDPDTRSVGSRTVSGTAVFHAGSRFDVDVDGGGADLLTVDGSVSLGGALFVNSLLSSDDRSILDQSYTIITADSVTGTFDDVSANFAFIDADVTYTSTAVEITLQDADPDPDPDPDPGPGPVPGTPTNGLAKLLSPFAKSGNGERFIAALNSIDQNADGYQALENRVLLLARGDEGSAVAKLSGEDVPASQTAARIISGRFVQSLQSRFSPAAANGGADGAGGQVAESPVGAVQYASLDPDFAGQSGGEGDATNHTAASSSTSVRREPGSRAWVRLVGDDSRLSGKDDLPGVSTRGAGVHAGLDHRFGGEQAPYTLGAAVGFEHGRIRGSDRLARTEYDAFSGGFYGQARVGGFRFSGAGSMTRLNLDSERQIPGIDTATGSFSAEVWSADAEVAYDLAILPDHDGVRISPFAGLTYAHTSRNGYREDGIGGLNVASAHEDSFRARIGAELAFAPTDGLTLTSRANWSRELLSPSSSTEATLLGSDSFTIEGRELPRDLGEVGVGLDVSLTDRIEGFAAYDGRFASGYRDHSGQIGLRVRW